MQGGIPPPVGLLIWGANLAVAVGIGAAGVVVPECALLSGALKWNATLKWNTTLKWNSKLNPVIRGSHPERIATCVGSAGAENAGKPVTTSIKSG